MKKAMVFFVMVCLLFGGTAQALDWTTSVIFLGSVDDDVRMASSSGIGFTQTGNGKFMITGGTWGPTGNVEPDPLFDRNSFLAIETDNPLAGWARSHFFTVTGGTTRSGEAIALPNGNVFGILDGYKPVPDSDPVQYERGWFSVYDDATETWGATDTFGVQTFGVNRCRGVATGNNATDVSISSAYAYFSSYFIFYDANVPDWVGEILHTSGGGAGSREGCITNIAAENSITLDSQNNIHLLKFFANAAGFTDTLVIRKRVGAAWEDEAVPGTGVADYAQNYACASFALYQDRPYVVFANITVYGPGNTRRGQLYFTYKDSEGVWSAPLLLDPDYLYHNVSGAQYSGGEGQIHANIRINANGKIVIAYSHRIDATTGETRVVIGDVTDPATFTAPEKVPVPAGQTDNAFFDPQFIFDKDNPNKIHLIHRTPVTADLSPNGSGSGFYRDCFYATALLDGAAVPPVASDVAVSGAPLVGEELTGSYTYTSETPEGTSTFRWLVADTADGAYTAIPGAIALTYTPTAADWGKFLKFEVTPVDEDDNAGTPAESAAFGPIEVKGDFNGDGALDTLDITGFKQALADKVTWESTTGRDADLIGDFNDDGAMDTLDITGFKQALAG